MLNKLKVRTLSCYSHKINYIWGHSTYSLRALPDKHTLLFICWGPTSTKWLLTALQAFWNVQSEPPTYAQRSECFDDRSDRARSRCSHTLSAAHSFGSAMLSLHILGTRKMCLLLWMSAPILVQQPLLPPILEPPSHISHALFWWWGIKNIRRVQQMKWKLWTVSKNFCKLHISISVAWARQQPRPFYTIWYISELSPAHWRATFVRRLYSESFGFC